MKKEKELKKERRRTNSQVGLVAWRFIGRSERIAEASCTKSTDLWDILMVYYGKGYVSLA